MGGEQGQGSGVSKVCHLPEVEGVAGFGGCRMDGWRRAGEWRFGRIRIPDAYRHRMSARKLPFALTTIRHTDTLSEVYYTKLNREIPTSGANTQFGLIGKTVRVRRGCATVNGEPADTSPLPLLVSQRREGVGPAWSRKPGDLPGVNEEIRSAPNRVVSPGIVHRRDGMYA